MHIWAPVAWERKEGRECETCRCWLSSHTPTAYTPPSIQVHYTWCVAASWFNKRGFCLTKSLTSTTCPCLLSLLPLHRLECAHYSCTTSRWFPGLRANLNNNRRRWGNVPSTEWSSRPALLAVRRYSDWPTPCATLSESSDAPRTVSTARKLACQRNIHSCTVTLFQTIWANRTNHTSMQANTTWWSLGSNSCRSGAMKCYKQ